ncbi:MAG: methionine--tRNA ligase [Spirochaetales bacterium]|nr:MAG: methionine--tRNA ligase [Spirochaetales bacterium]
MSEKKKVLVSIAWPYANGDLHVGHIAGAYLPADIYARYHRLAGNDVLVVSGSDSHGTPITVRADQEGVSPREIFERYHTRFLETQRDIGISYNLFTHTDTPNHHRVSQDIFLGLLHNGYLYVEKQQQYYSEVSQQFLPDRYVEGTCPYCDYAEARGDQCDNCGRLLDALELKNPRSKIDGATPVIRETEHFFLDLEKLEPRVLDYLQTGKEEWRPNVLKFSLNYVKGGLKGRPITRDIEWGIPVPLDGYPGKRLYVWFEAVIGYLSASMEWAERSGDKDAWKRFWQGDVKSYYFVGKDNVPFHTIIWPAMLMGHGGLSLPYDVPANEFLTIKGRRLSTSRNWAVWLPDYLERYDPDALRYFLSINMPEDGDTDFSWQEFVRRNNDELVATYGNLVNRVLTITFRNFDGKVPTPGKIDDRSAALLEKARQTFNDVDGMIGKCYFRETIRTVLSLSQEANRYLDEKAPWKTIKVNREDAATALYVALSVISHLKTMLSPFLPFTCAKLHKYLGLPGSIEDAGWAVAKIVPGQQLVKPEILFVKLDDSVVEKEDAKLEGGRAA